jgi:hypothetical protein
MALLWPCTALGWTLWRASPPKQPIMGGQWGRGGSAAPPGSPPHSPVAGMMPPRLSLPPLPDLCFLPMQPAPALRTSLDGPLAVEPLLLRQLLLLLQLPWGVGICVCVCHCCCRHCHGSDLAVIFAASAAVAAAVGGGRTCMIAS